jgi:hypothetical protein
MKPRPWINIENEDGDQVMMRWPDKETTGTKMAARNFFWICIGLGVVLLAAFGFCKIGLLCIDALLDTIGGG